MGYSFLLIAMATVLDILTRAALNIGAVQAGEPLDSGEAQDILATWNALIDSNTIQSGSIYAIQKDAYTLSPTVQGYTLGTDTLGNPGTFGAVRPVRITGINLVVTAGGTPVKYPLLGMSDDEWREVALYANQGLPQRYYHDRAYPLSTLNFYVVPDQAYGVEVFSWSKLTQQVNLTDTVAFPEGYERFWVTKLAIEIAPMFQREPSPTLIALMEDATQAVRSHNRKSPRLVSDPALMNRSRNSYNYRTGQGIL